MSNRQDKGTIMIKWIINQICLIDIEIKYIEMTYKMSVFNESIKKDQYFVINTIKIR